MHKVGDVVVQPDAGDLVRTQFLAELGVEPEPATEVDLEPLDLVPVVVQDQLALEPDVGDLGSGAGVRAAVDVDGDGGVEVGKAAFELRRLKYGF